MIDKEKIKELLNNAKEHMDDDPCAGPWDSGNLIHFDEGKWWFWNETHGQSREGPFETEQKAKDALSEYVGHLYDAIEEDRKTHYEGSKKQE